MEELQNAKPLLVYHFIDGLTQANDKNYKFSQAFEIKILSKDRVIAVINEKWRAKKVPIDIDAERKDKKNQARIEFWSYTGVKMGALTLKSSMSSRSFTTKLRSYAAKNKALCKKEIKRLEASAKARAKGSDHYDEG